MMGSLTGNCSEDPNDYRCYLPTTGREEVSDEIWQNVSFGIFDRDGEPEAHPRETVLDQDTVLRSWAILLGSYTRSELVSFAELYELEFPQVDTQDSKPKASSLRIETCLLRYRIRDQSGLPILANKTQISEKTYSELGLVNTAIWLSEDLYQCKDKNYRPASSERLEKLVNKNQVSDSFTRPRRDLRMLGSLCSSAPFV